MFAWQMLGKWIYKVLLVTYALESSSNPLELCIALDQSEFICTSDADSIAAERSCLFELGPLETIEGVLIDCWGKEEMTAECLH